jgi:molecular chaperone DnaK (HSP70)
MSGPDEPVNVGLDFGTTNSLLTYFMPGEGLAPFLPQGSDDFGVPTVIDDGDSLRERMIGWLALKGQRVRRHFKLGLGNWDGRTDNAKFRDSEIFLSRLFEEFARTVPAGMRNVVVGVPESWASDREPGGDAIRKIFERLGLPSPRLLSEPVAAACYFAYRRMLPGEEPFKGHVLIYDHGGGTLDLTLCAINGSYIETVYSDGMGLDQSKLGFGGAAYDHTVLNHLKQRKSNTALLQIDRDTSKRARWLVEFEQQKRGFAPAIKQQISSGRFNEFKYRRTFAVGETDVTLSDLVKPFDEEFLPRIQERLDRFIATCRKVCPTLVLDNPDRFRVVPVGGFSEFYPVQRMLEFYFRHPDVSGTASVIDTRLRPDERWQAVSKGACVVASDAVMLNEYPPFAFGLVTWRGAEKIHTHIIRHDTPLRQLQQRSWLPREYTADAFDEGDHPSVQFFTERGGAISYAPRMPRSLRETLPEFKRADAWRFGGSVRNGFVYVDMQGVRGGVPVGAVKSIRLGKFFNLQDGTLEDTQP